MTRIYQYWPIIKIMSLKVKERMKGKLFSFFYKLIAVILRFQDSFTENNKKTCYYIYLE